MTQIRARASRTAATSHRRSLVPLLVALAALAALALAGQALGARDLTVNITAPAVVQDNETFDLDLSAYNTGSGAGSSVQIQLYMDGNATAGPHDVGNLANGEYGNASENFTLTCGVYHFSAMVDPSDGVPETNESNNNASFTLLVVPFINASTNLSGTLGAYNLTLDASASHGCEPLNFTWTIDGDLYYGPVLTYYPSAGNVTLELTVSSSADRNFTNSKTIVYGVPNAPPTVELTPSNVSIQTLEHNLISINAVDTDGAIASYLISFGDGSTTTVLADGPQYEYHSSGTFTLTVTVVDNLGASATASATVMVSNRAPVADVEFTNWITNAGSAVPFNASGSADPEGGALTFSWDFGDGSTGIGPLVNHTYANAGHYVANVTVSDSSGASQTVSIAVQVEGPARPQTGGSFPWLWILILVLLAAVAFLLWARRRKGDDETHKGDAPTPVTPASEGETKPGEGSSSKPPSP